jgi:hypothetical protein
MATRKHFGYTASILKGTNRVIASSQADWGSLIEGSFIIFDEDDNFYKIVNKENFFYIKDFERVESDKIFIHESVGLKLGLNDSIRLTFKEYEVSEISIKEKGSDFREGEILTLQGGLSKKDLVNDVDIPTQLKVTEVDKDGGILKIEVDTHGVYIEAPESKQAFGKAEIEINLSLLDKRTIEDRSIANLLYSEKGTVIVLNHPLPPNTQNGKISTTKWELILETNYLRDNKINAQYRVLTDFTPNLKLPLLRDDISKNEAILNQALMTIDKELQELKDKLI